MSLFIRDGQLRWRRLVVLGFAVLWLAGLVVLAIFEEWQRPSAFALIFSGVSVASALWVEFGRSPPPTDGRWPYSDTPEE